jgi:hypothetical protein
VVEVGYCSEDALVKVMRLVIQGAMAARSVVAIGLLACVIAMGAGSFAAGQGLEANYSLRGTVVNSVTGEPIHNALVTLSSDESRSVFTAADGSFEFRDLKGGANEGFSSRGRVTFRRSWCGIRDTPPARARFL